MTEYILVVLHKLDDSFGYYDVQSGEQIYLKKTRPFPHEVCLSPDRSKLYIAEMGVRGVESEGPGGNTVAVYETRTAAEMDSIKTGIYDRPHGLVSHPDELLLVTSESTKHLLVFSIESEELEKAIYLGQDYAHMVNVSPDAKRAYTTNIGSNSITEIDMEKLEVVRHIPLLERPEGMAFSPDGRLIYVVCRESKAVAVVDSEKGELISKIETGDGPVRVVISPDGSKLAIPLFHSSAVDIVDTKEAKVINHTKVGPHPAGTAISPDGKLVFMACEDENLVYVFDLETFEVINTISTGNGCDAMVCLFRQEIE